MELPWTTTSNKKMNVHVKVVMVITIAEMTAKTTIKEIAGTIEIIKIIEIKNTTDVKMIICITEIEIDKVVVITIILISLPRVNRIFIVNNLECIRISHISSLRFWIRIQVICFLRRTHYSPSKLRWTIIKVVKSKHQVKLVCHRTHNSNLIQVFQAFLSQILLSLQL